MRRILLLSLCAASALFAACNDTSIVSGAGGQPTTPPVTSPTATLTATPTATATETASPTAIPSDTPPATPTPSPTSTLSGVPTPQWTPVVVGDGIPGPLSGVYTDEGPADPTQPFRSLLGFPIRDEAALADRIRNIYDPSSADFRAYLTPAEWDASYAPSAADVELIKEYLVYEGFTVNFEAANHLLLQFSGTVAQFNTAFLADLHVCMRANPQQGNPPIAVFCTLDQFTLPQFVADRTTGIITADFPADTGSLPNDIGTVNTAPPSGWGFTPDQIAHAYGVSSLYSQGHHGEGVVLGVAIGQLYKPTDLQSFWGAFGVTRDLPTIVQTMEPVVSRNREATIDVEWSGVLAPGAAMRVYAAPDSHNTSMIFNFNEAIARDEVNVLTDSFAHREDSEPLLVRRTYDDSAMEAAALGITVMAAAGDSGQPDTPCGSPYVTCVGGTSLSMSGNTVTGESAWSMSGSGDTKSFALPYWQQGVLPGGAHRAVTDVALNAWGHGYFDYYLGSWETYAGTSFASPTFAGTMTVVDSARMSSAMPAAGWLNPLLYGNAAVQATFRDVTSGSTADHAAGPGWDYPTGWGAPNAAGLAGALP